MRKYLSPLIAALIALLFFFSACSSGGGDGVKVTGVSLNKRTTTIAAGNAEQLTATIAPGNAANKAVTWQGSVHAVASVSATGLVTALSAGQTTITVTTIDGGFEDRCLVTVMPAPVAVSNVTLNKSSMTLMESKTEQLTATIEPEDAADKAMTWHSNAPDIARVSQDGLVTAISQGQANITVTTIDGGFNAGCAVTVTPLALAVTGLKLDRTGAEMLRGDTMQLTATAISASADNKGVSWISSKPNIASVTDQGLVTAHAIGEAIITATTGEGGFAATCRVLVVYALSNVYIAGADDSRKYPLWGINYQTEWLSYNPAVDYDRTWGEARSVFVSGGMAYVAGWDDVTPPSYNYVYQAVVWINGQVYQYLDKPLGPYVESRAYSVYVAGQDIYVGGWHGNDPYIWKNNVSQSLPYEGTYAGVNSIAVSDGVVYAAGYDFYYNNNDESGVLRPVVWQGGTRYELQRFEDWSEALSIAVSGSDYYAAGYATNTDGFERAVIWKNGEQQQLAPVPGASHASAESVCVANGKVYAAGYAVFWDDYYNVYYYVAVIWENGIPRFIHDPDPDKESQAYSVYVHNGFVYAAGYMFDWGTGDFGTQNMVVWMEGYPRVVTPPQATLLNFNAVRSVFVR